MNKDTETEGILTLAWEWFINLSWTEIANTTLPILISTIVVAMIYCCWDYIKEGFTLAWSKIYDYIMELPRHTVNIQMEYEYYGHKKSTWSLGTASNIRGIFLRGKWFVTNKTDRPIMITNASISNWTPKGMAPVYLKNLDNQPLNEILPHSTALAEASFFIEGEFNQEKDLSYKLILFDQYGNKNILRNSTFSRIGSSTQGVEAVDCGELLSTISNPIEKKIVGVLKFELDRYSGCGRRCGGLGSLVTKINSREIKGVPNSCREADSPKNQSLASGTISSDNASTLISFYNSLSSDEDKQTFSSCLLNRLSKASEYSDIGYFIFYISFKTGKLSEALPIAKKDLFGDKKHGFSNLLMIVDGLLGCEHTSFSDNDLNEIEKFVHGLQEHPFRIPEKINAIRTLRVTV
jgi:hypothetical protein